MEYQRLGTSGLKVSKIILGCMSFGSRSWVPWVIEDEEEVFRLLKKAYDVGIRTWDTANIYSNGQSEILIGKFIKKYNIPRESLVILTKVYHKCDEDGAIAKDPIGEELAWANRRGLSRKHILESVEASARRLGTYIDVLQIHRYDKEVPPEEVMEALHDVVKAGKVRYIGGSSMKAVEFAMLQGIAEKNRWTKFISMQGFYNLLYREEEREMNYYCDLTGVGLIPWSPLAQGTLCRPWKGGDSTRSNSFKKVSEAWYSSQADKTVIDRVEEVAKKLGVSMTQVSVAWVLSKGAAPILGLSKEIRIDEAVEALKVKLSNEDIAYLEEPYQAKSILWENF